MIVGSDHCVTLCVGPTKVKSGENPHKKLTIQLTTNFLCEDILRNVGK